MEETAKHGPDIRTLRRRKTRRQDAILNLFTSLLALATGFLLLWFGLIYINPWNPTNPFPPPLRTAAAAGVKASAQTGEVPKTALPLPSATVPPTNTPTLAPSQTPMAAATLPASPTQAGTRINPTATRNGYIYPYMLQGPPAGIPATMFNPDRACRWLGIAGQAFDKQSRPATGIRVWLNGTFNGAAVDVNTLTGTALRYGQAGYEFTLADRPIASKSLLYVRLMNQMDVQVSERVQIETVEDCNRSLIIVNFVQVK